MSVESIVKAAVEGNPLEVKAAFEEEIAQRITKAIEEKVSRQEGKEDGEESCPDCHGKGCDEDGAECGTCAGEGKVVKADGSSSSKKDKDSASPSKEEPSNDMSAAAQ